MQTGRRAFLSTLGVLAAGLVLPPPLMARALNPNQLDDLHAHAQGLARRVHFEPPRTMLREAGEYLHDVETFLPLALGRTRTSLHRTAALTALVGAQASRWAGDGRTGGLLTRADDHARAAGDGAIRAQGLVLRAKQIGEAAYSVDAGSLPAQKLLTGALALAGPAPLLRALIRFELAWDFAAVGDCRGAMMELDAAETEYGRAAPAPDVVEAADGAWQERCWASGYRGATLRQLGVHEEALAACSEELNGGARLGAPSYQTFALVDVARSRAALGDVDAAAMDLSAAWRLNAQAGLTQRQGRVRAARKLLPSTLAVRQLDELMHG